MGPLRVFPGSLSVSRTFGDAQAKIERLGGNINGVICDPEITVFKIRPEHDFILLASDGIFENLQSNQAIECMWKEIINNPGNGIHDSSAAAIEELMR